MILLGITGAIGHGKTSFADALSTIEPASVHLETSYLVSKIADGLHEKLSAPIQPDDIDAINAWLEALPGIITENLHTSVSFEDIKLIPSELVANPQDYQKLFEHLTALQQDFSLAKTQIATENKASYRAILQWLGGYLVKRVGPGVWYDELVRVAQEAIKQGAKLAIVGGVRYPGDAEILRHAGGKIVSIVRPGTGETDITDSTESNRNEIVADVTVINNGTVADLTDVAAALVSDLNSGTLKPEYSAVAS